jgi:hypothetical protein
MACSLKYTNKNNSNKVSLIIENYYFKNKDSLDCKVLTYMV